MRHPSSCLLWLLLFTFATFGHSACNTQEIYAPAYVYVWPCAGTPGCAWDVFKSNATLVTINPDNGPNFSWNPDYVMLAKSIKTGNSAVKIVLGHVSTNYANRDPALVLADIDLYYDYYAVDGIFLDEGSTACDNKTLNLYKSYDERVKGKGGRGYTVLNWGRNGMECFLTNTRIDNYVTFENVSAVYSTTAPADWVNGYNSSRFWNILHTAPDDPASVTAAVATAKSRNVGQVYITNDVLPNPFDTAPSPTVWDAQVSKARSCT